MTVNPYQEQALRPMPPDKIDVLVGAAREHDPDLVAVFVLHGSESRGLGLSGWTAIEDDSGLEQALELLEHAVYDPEIPEIPQET